MKKHNLMYSIFGIDENHKCRECCNFGMYQRGNHSYSKCEVYGISHSEATDWNGRKAACGHFNKPYDKAKENNIMHLARPVRRDANYQCEGQMNLEE
ncbi:MAG: hypothetical protein ACI4EA_08095 [Candidatus Ornithomonoglobus sp.]